MAVCGSDTNATCFPTKSSHPAPVDCLNRLCPTWTHTTCHNHRMVHGSWAVTQLKVFKLTFPQVDFEKFTNANFNASQGQPRFPAGILHAESEDEVIKAVNCASKAGYKVSPRGRGHSCQGLSSMDGYLVIFSGLEWLCHGQV